MMVTNERLPIIIICPINVYKQTRTTTTTTTTTQHSTQYNNNQLIDNKTISVYYSTFTQISFIFFYIHTLIKV